MNKNQENSDMILNMAQQEIAHLKTRDQELQLEIHQMEEAIKGKKEEMKNNGKLVTIYRHLSEEAAKLTE